MTNWTPHADGFVNGDVGVFPFHFGSWEVWVKTDREWRRHDALMPFETIEEAKAAASRIHGEDQKR